MAVDNMTGEKELRDYLALYQKWGCSIIPIANKTKIPLIEWKEYQTRRPDQDELIEWWDNNWSNGNQSNIGIVCGRVSGNLVVLDFDTEDSWAEFLRQWDNLGLSNIYQTTLVVKTARGYQVYLRTKQPVQKQRLNGLDIQGEGSYVVAPPSVHPSGNVYEFINRDIDRILEIEDLAEIGIKLPVNSLPNKAIEGMLKGVMEGERNSSAFSLARGLRNSGVSIDACSELLTVWNERNEPSLPLKELEDTICSVYSREEGLTPAIREFIRQTKGSFTVSQLDNELGITGRQKEYRKVILHRLVGESLIERVKPGQYRVKESSLPDMDWQSADTSNSLDLSFPFGIDELVEIYPRNVIVIAGIPNSGKTAVLLNFIRLNMRKHDIHYFTSELSEQELKKRLEMFGNSIDWTFHPHERNGDFDSVIVPDAINVIDYLEPPSGEYFKIGDQIATIHNKLTTGVAFIAIQKKRKEKLGRGAEFSEERARLYLSLDSRHLEIVKAKNWKTKTNPNGITYTFKLVDGCKFVDIQRSHE